MLKIGDVTSTADENGEFTNGRVAAGIAPTIMEADWYNAVQRELVNVVEGAGIALDKDDFTQVYRAVKATAIANHPYDEELCTAIAGYPKGSMLLSTDGTTLWQNTVDNNTTNPDSDSANGWVKINKTQKINIIKFEASGTYTPSPGTQFIVVEACGGGGAGGGATVSTSGMTSVGSGGGAGGYCKGKFDISEISSPVSITIGAGGFGVIGASGGVGGSTSFGSFFTCNGGVGGTRAGPANTSFGTAGGFGGVASGANISNFRGERGGNAYTTYPSYTFGGNGGSSPLGTGGPSSVSANGVNGYGYGSGGGGLEISSGPTGTYRGGNGADGVVIITEYILS